MRTNNRITVAHAARHLALGIMIFATAGSIAVAQTQPGPNAPPVNSAPNTGWGAFDPQYDAVAAWNARWDAGDYDRHHVIVGTVADFKPFRMLLQPADPEGHATMIDLKNGTVIRPEGTTLVAGMRVAVFGYWSKGTFIANHVVLRQSS